MSTSKSPPSVLPSFFATVRSALALPHPTLLLLFGPPGCGKTTLAIDAARSTDGDLLMFPHALLSAPEAGTIEPAVSAFFASAAAAAPAVVLIDNIDSIAPPQPAGGADFRALAALNAALDELELDPDGYAGLVVIATCAYMKDIHNSLLRPGRFSEVINIPPPSWSQRRRLLSILAGDSVLNESGEVLLDELASMTPGFLPADLETLASEADLEVLRDGGEEDVKQSSAKQSYGPETKQNSLLSAMAKVVHSVRPTLLTSVGEAWVAVPWSENALKGLFGLEEQIGEVSMCVQGVFSDCLEKVGPDASKAHQSLKALGMPGGVLLHGPSGSGKTALVKAAPSFLRRGAVNAFCLDAAEIVGAVVGAAERKLRSLFMLARAAAPTILIIENIDVLAPRRSLDEADEAPGETSTAAFRRLLSTLLVELDGIVKASALSEGETGETRENRSPVLLMATTTDMSRVDPALLRPGRLEVHVRMTLPPEEARAKVLSEFCREYAPHLGVAEGCLPSFIDEIAKCTQGWAAVDVQSLCHEAVMRRVREVGVSLGSEAPKVEEQHFLDALRSASPDPSLCFKP